MSLHQIKSGEVVSLTSGKPLPIAQTITLAKTKELEVLRLVLPAGKAIPTHKVAGPVTVQCLEGRIALLAHGKRQELGAGDFLFLEGNEPHALEGLTSAAVLVTIVLKPKAADRHFDVVQEASEESFPASDAPAY